MLHKPFYWHREVVREVHIAGEPKEACVRCGREHVEQKGHLPHFNTWPNQTVLFGRSRTQGQFTDTESI